MANPGLHPDALTHLQNMVNPSHTVPEGVRGDCYAVLLRGHWGIPEHGSIGVLLDFKAPYSRLELSVLPLISLEAHFNPNAIEQWEFQLKVLQEQVDRQQMARSGDGILLSPFPANLVLASPRPFHYPDPQTALSRLRTMYTAFHPDLEQKREQVGGTLANPPAADHAGISFLRSRFGELMLIERSNGAAIYHGNKKWVSVIEREQCDAFAVLESALRLGELRGADESASICLIASGSIALLETASLIERLKRMDVSLVLAPSDPDFTRSK